MSFIDIKKDESLRIIDWEVPEPKFRLKKDANQPDSEPYTKMFKRKIFDKYGCDLTNKAGCHIGKRDVSVYLQCKDHKRAFTCEIKRKLFKQNVDLKFTISRAKPDENCNCRKLKYFHKLYFYLR